MPREFETLRGDIEFEGLRWVNDFRDLLFYLSKDSGDSLEIIFRDAQNLIISMNWQDTAANALSWDIEWTSVGKKHWVVRMQFPPHGFIQCEANELEINGRTFRPEQ